VTRLRQELILGIGGVLMLDALGIHPGVLHLDLAEGLRLGTAAGTATAMTPGTQLRTRADIERLIPAIEIRELA